MEVIAAKLIGFGLKNWKWFAMAGLILALKVQGGWLHSAKVERDAARKASAENYAVAMDYHNRIVPGWKAYAATLVGRWTAERDLAATRIADAAEARQRASSSAFDNGYTAGRIAGRKLCGVQNEASPSAAHGSAAVSVRDPEDDLAVIWRRGAYVPPGPVPRVR